MATKKSVKDDYVPNIQLKIQPLFTETLFNEILPYTLENWGVNVLLELRKEIDKRILSLYLMPNANPISRFIESTAAKVYRNIILKKYPFIIVYSVKGSVVTVLNIIHQSLNPAMHQKLIRQPRKK